MIKKVIIILFLTLFFSIGILAAAYFEAVQLDAADNGGIAQIHINTSGSEISSKEYRVLATMEVKNGKNSNFPLEGLYKGLIGIKGRGNSSWNISDKKPYSIKLWSKKLNTKSRQILDLPPEEDWLLIPNHSDKSLLRNYITNRFSREIGMEFVPKVRFAEVYINGEYQGLYLLSEKIKRDENRVNIAILDESKINQTEPNITGGYILRLDRDEGRESFVTDTAKNTILFHYPKAEKITEAQKEYIIGYINEFEKVLYSDYFIDPVNGYRKYIDVDSFIDYLLVMELTLDVDGWGLSTYFYKDQGEKLKMGPVWDFDLAYGNADYFNNGSAEEWNNAVTSKRSWFNRLLQDEWFVKEFIKRWNEIKPTAEKMCEWIDEKGKMLEEYANRNFEKWDILGKYVWPNVSPYPTTYKGELERLKLWITNRIDWLGKHITNISSAVN